METCGSAHHWGRVALAAGHEAQLIPALYVKPFGKRHKNDTLDAEAIVEAASRPSMRTVAVKNEDQQAQAMLFRTREMFVGQRTQLINAGMDGCLRNDAVQSLAALQKPSFRWWKPISGKSR